MNTPDRTRTSVAESDLRELLRFCSPATYAAARQFAESRDSASLSTIITGVIESHTDRDLRSKLETGDGSLRLREDLGLDSLGLMEIALLFDDLLQVTLGNEELSRLRTLDDVHQCFREKLCGAGEAVAPAARAAAVAGAWAPRPA